MARVTGRLLGILIFLGIFLGGLELGLRAFPAELIPVDWLKRFQSNLRLEIAEAAGVAEPASVVGVAAR
jgi:hypothetical protein